MKDWAGAAELLVLFVGAALLVYACDRPKEKCIEKGCNWEHDACFCVGSAP